jgi:hypothetical protein
MKEETQFSHEDWQSLKMLQILQEKLPVKRSCKSLKKSCISLKKSSPSLKKNCQSLKAGPSRAANLELAISPECAVQLVSQEEMSVPQEYVN